MTEQDMMWVERLVDMKVEAALARFVDNNIETMIEAAGRAPLDAVDTAAEIVRLRGSGG